MLLDLFLYCFEYSFFVLYIWCFDYYVTGGISFLVQFIWCSVGFLYVHGHLFLWVWEVFFYNFVKDIYWHSELGIFALSVTIIHRFGLLIVSRILWMFWVRSLLPFAFSLTAVSIFSMTSFAPEILSCNLLVMFASVAPDLFPRVSISRVVSLCDFFIVSISIFRF